MDDLGELPRIACDEDWLNLDEGERCLVRGRLHMALKKGDNSLIVSNTSWELILVNVPAGYSGEERPSGANVSAIATRTEDGLEMISDDIFVHEEEM